MTDARDDDELPELPGGVEADAAEYALGVMPTPEREAFEARMLAEPDLAQDVDTWTEYFATLTDGFPAVVPPGTLIRRIEARVHGAPPPAAWRQLLPYVLGAVGGAAFAWAVMVSGVLVDTGTGTGTGNGTGEIRADLAPVAGDLVFAVRIDPPTHTVWVELTSGAPPEGRALEVWLIPPGAAPLSLGVMNAQGRMATVLTDALAAQVPGATMAVSDEPEGGSPTGAPTGDVQAAGVPIPL